jgi:hypothetical protein
MSPIHHMVRRRWLLPRPAASTTPLWKIFSRASQSLLVHFFLNNHSAVVLFDSGTTHNFISKACTQKCKLVIEPISAPNMISTPGGQIVTKQVVVSPSLNLKGRIYKTCLIILDGQGIDVILEMSWMKRHQVLLVTATRGGTFGFSRAWQCYLVAHLDPCACCVGTPYHRLESRGYSFCLQVS